MIFWDFLSFAKTRLRCDKLLTYMLSETICNSRDKFCEMNAKWQYPKIPKPCTAAIPFRIFFKAKNRCGATFDSLKCTIMRKSRICKQTVDRILFSCFS